MIKSFAVSLGLLFASAGVVAAGMPSTPGCFIAEVVQRNAEPVQGQLDRLVLDERALRQAVLGEIEGWVGPDTLKRMSSEKFVEMQRQAAKLADRRHELEAMLAEIVDRECASLVVFKPMGGA